MPRAGDNDCVDFKPQVLVYQLTTNVTLEKLIKTPMAKAIAKPSPEKAPVKKATVKAKTSAPATSNIEKVAEEVLIKLKTLNLEPQLQADIEWCLGSYRHDKNPAGLYEMAEKAFGLFKNEQSKKTKGITSKLVGEVEKVLNSR